jgi:hypothetical protein
LTEKKKSRFRIGEGRRRRRRRLLCDTNKKKKTLSYERRSMLFYCGIERIPKWPMAGAPLHSDKTPPPFKCHCLPNHHKYPKITTITYNNMKECLRFFLLTYFENVVIFG